MNLLYFGVPGGNFGDDLNVWLWDELLPGWRDWPKDAVLVGVGTILKRGFVPEGVPKLVLGSGVGYGEPPDIKSNPELWDIRAVRGPLTAAALGLPPSRAIVDAAVMLPRLPRFQAIAKTDRILFVPHHGSEGLLDWAALCEEVGITALSPSGDPDAVIAQLASARMVIAESMHAAIIADAFRVPWQAVAIARKFNRFKWRDWGNSLGIEPRFVQFFPLLRSAQKLALKLFPRKAGPASHSEAAGGSREYRAKGLKRRLLEASARRMLRKLARQSGQLSDTSALTNAQDRFAAMLAEVAKDYEA